VPRRLSIVAAAALCALATAAVAAGDTPSEWWLQAIDANPAAAPGPGVPIVVIDGAVDQSQPAFAGRANTTYLDSPTLDGPQDFHATSVAALAAASGPNGYTGVYPQAMLELWDAGRGANGIDGASAARGIITAAEHCPAVLNLSFGGSEPSPDVEAAIFRAVRAGCLVVAAAGNSGLQGDPETYPASYPHVFTVGATDEQGNPETFSSSGPWVDVAAPGVDMTAPVPLTTDPSGFSRGLAGTSFAAPLVSAAAAWIWTVRPTLSASQVAELLRESARAVGPQRFDTKAGFGVIDVAAALALRTPPPDPVEPNDDVAEVKPGLFFSSGQPPITTKTHPSTRLAGTVTQSEDPRDLYRIWIPARRKVHVSLTPKGSAVAQIWGPATVSLDESQTLRKRDLAGSSITGGAKGVYAYAEVKLTGRTQSATYVLSVTAAKR
jgi:subtilisin family serine protease